VKHTFLSDASHAPAAWWKSHAFFTLINNNIFDAATQFKKTYLAVLA